MNVAHPAMPLAAAAMRLIKLVEK